MCKCSSAEEAFLSNQMHQKVAKTALLLYNNSFYLPKRQRWHSGLAGTPKHWMGIPNPLWSQKSQCRKRYEQVSYLHNKAHTYLVKFSSLAFPSEAYR